MNSVQTYINQESETITYFEGALKNGKIKQERIWSVKSAILRSTLTKTIAHYSAGDAKETVTESLLATISAFEEGFKWEGFENSYAMYDQMVWLLSLGIVCDISDRDFRRIVSIIQRDGAADKLLALLINHRLPGTISGYTKPYIQQEPYAAFDKVIEEPTIANITTYLDKFWYNGHRDAPWYDAHKNTKVNVYFGYWSWESAALAKIVGLSDEALRDQKYYPYRAVHWDETPDGVGMRCLFFVHSEFDNPRQTLNKKFRYY